MQTWMVRVALGSTCAVAAAIAGCASVNPRPDYQRAAEHVRRSAGVERLFDPEQLEADARYIDECLSDGLTAEEAARVALLNNVELQAALYDIGAARADLVQAGLLSNPSLGVALRLPSAGGLANIDFDLAQNIAELWQIPVRKRAAERGLDATILAVARLATETAASARTAYYGAAGANRRLEIARENLDVGQKVLELTEFRRQAGAGSELDVNLARGVLLEAELAVKNARLAADSARRALATVLGVSLDADELVLAEDLPEPPAHLFDERLLTAIAWDERLDARALRQSVQGAREQLVLQMRRVFPNVSLGLAFERDARPRAQGRDILADTARASIAAGRLTAPEIESRSARGVDTDFIIGPLLSLELPVFDQNQAQIAKARFTLEQRVRVLEGLGRTIHQEVREAVDQAQTAWEVARFYRDELVPQVSRSLELSRESYRAGQSSILSVLDAERSYLAARDRYAEAMQLAAAAAPLVERTIGLPFEHLLEEMRRRPPEPTPTTRPAGPESAERTEP
ncbi:MAG: TolC family protein [Phycisphaerae bacterium]|jgi:cobalt-zinc-cadmium efflux system outer membrane protein